MAAEVQTFNGAVHLTISSGLGQYAIAVSSTAIYVIRQQPFGQHLIAFAFLHGTELNTNFNFVIAPTAEDHAVVVELRDALHAAHSVEGLPLPNPADEIVRVVEQSVEQVLQQLGVDA